VTAETAGGTTYLPRVAAVASVLAGLVHYAAVPEHRAEWFWYGAFFTLAGALQIVWAALAWTGQRRWLAVGAVGTVALIGLWVFTRTVGVPFGPHAGAVEGIGVLDAVCVAVEAVTALCALAALRARAGLTAARRYTAPPGEAAAGS